MSCRVVSAFKSSAIAVLVLALAACAGGPVPGGDSNKLAGDENGGKISEALGPAQSQSMKLVTSHCAMHDQKGFITKMDYDSNTITFECRKQARS
jgi:hypothetical protein